MVDERVYEMFRDIGRDILAMARKGLAHRGNKDARGQDETQFLDPLDAVIAGRTQAEELIERFKGPWQGSVDPAFSECVY